MLGAMVEDRATARDRLESAIASGAAAEKFKEIIEAQGGNPGVVDDPAVLPQARDRAKDLGIINIAIVCPGAIGALIEAPLVSLAGYPALFAELRGRGWSDDDCTALAHGNRRTIWGCGNLKPGVLNCDNSLD